jgi:ABC-2 type transport system ATP-binding protein
METDKNGVPTGAVVVEANELTKKFGDFTAVDHVTMKITEGSVYGFLGPNGSGKSTTIKVLCGLLAPTSGTGKVLGKSINEKGHSIKSEVGYMSQKFSLYPELTVIENLNLYSGLYGLRGDSKKKRIAEMLDLAGLKGREDEPTGLLSGGWRQRLALGCAILHRPKMLFLDEPTSGVDPKARRLFWDIIYDLSADGTTVMVTTHFMDEAEHCDRVAFIHFGKLIADDTPKRLKELIPGRLFEVSMKDGMEALASIQQGAAGPMLDAYFFGDKLHLLVEGERTIGSEPIFDGAEIKEIEPSMQDVFSYLVKSESGKAMEGGRLSGAGDSTIKLTARKEG